MGKWPYTPKSTFSPLPIAEHEAMCFAILPLSWVKEEVFCLGLGFGFEVWGSGFVVSAWGFVNLFRLGNIAAWGCV